MFEFEKLKENIEKRNGTIACPVCGCNTKVKIMNRQALNSLKSHLGKETSRKNFEQYFCKRHKIYITPSTFIYENYKDNLLWYNEDEHLIKEIIKGKRVKEQLYHSNSEDAVSWNIFRFLEKNNMICDFLEKKFNIIEENPEVIYWSYSQKEKGLWKPLKEAREEFELRLAKGSEPDIIIIGKNALIIIEAKFNASNRTPFNHKNPNVENKYRSGGEKWWNEVFRSDFKKVVIDENKYELSRFWLIGTWMAHGSNQKRNLDFYLVNLVLKEKEKEKDSESIFKKHIIENSRRKFLRFTWEEIYDYISKNNLSGENKDLIMSYFRNKTIGYYQGRLRPAFSIL